MMTPADKTLNAVIDQIEESIVMAQVELVHATAKVIFANTANINEGSVLEKIDRKYFSELLGLNNNIKIRKMAEILYSYDINCYGDALIKALDLDPTTVSFMAFPRDWCFMAITPK